MNRSRSIKNSTDRKMNRVSDHAIVVMPYNGMENRIYTDASKENSIEPFVNRKVIFPEKNTIKANNVEFNRLTNNRGSLLNTIPNNARIIENKGGQSNKGVPL
jgi:hypothetical protein